MTVTAPTAGFRLPGVGIEDVTPPLPRSLLTGVPVFLGIPAAAFVEARRGRGAWRAASVASGAGMLGFFVLAGAGFSGWPLSGGLYQRISLGIGLGWVTALLLRRR